MLITCRSMPSASMSASRSAPTGKPSRPSSWLRTARSMSVPLTRSSTSGTAQWQCMSTVRTRWPPIVTTRRRPCPAACRRPQATQKTPAEAAAARRKNCRRLGMANPLTLVLTLVLRKPLRLALLAKARAALGRFRRVRAALELALQLGQQIRRDRRLRQAAQQPLGLDQRVRTRHQHLVDQACQRGLAGVRRAKLVYEPDAQRFVGGEALAREQIAAQRAGIDRAQEERNERGRRKAEAHLRQREERVLRCDHHVAAGYQRDRAADTGAVDQRDGRLRHAVELEAERCNAGAWLVLRGGCADLGAGREMPAASPQHQRAHRRIGAE